MRVTTAFKHLLALPGMNVRAVEFLADRVVVTVALRRRRLVCPLCDHSTRARHNDQVVHSVWRHLDLGCWRLVIKARLRRLRCPSHGVREGVPFARHNSGFTRDFECLAAWLAVKTDKSSIERLLRIAWRTVGAIIFRVVADELDPDRLSDLFEIGMDEIAWRKRHKYLTLVTDHRSGKVVCGAKGKDAKAASKFFDDLGEKRCAQLSAVSFDLGRPPHVYVSLRIRRDQARPSYSRFAYNTLWLEPAA